MSGFFIFKKKIYTDYREKFYLRGYKILADLMYNSKKNIIVKDFFITFKNRNKGSSKMSFGVLVVLIQFIITTWINKNESN